MRINIESISKIRYNSKVLSVFFRNKKLNVGGKNEETVL